MPRKKTQASSGPSKAYLVSFGDTMTALLAFFIVLNAFAKEQTGANMYTGTGSFVNAVKSLGISGLHGQNRSAGVVIRDHQSPLYALAENLHRNQEDSIGPGDEGEKDHVIDYDKEVFQKFLYEVNEKYGLKQTPSMSDPVVFDSFESFQKTPDSKKVLSQHAVRLASDTISKLRDARTNLEIIVWATMPSPVVIENDLKLSRDLESQLDQLFWITPEQKRRMRIIVKPWLFSDARRPVISFSLSKTL